MRQGTPSELLPDCRAYEQVSPTDKNGFGVIPAPVIASGDGEAVSFASPGAFAGAPVGAFPNGYGALRGASDWQIHPMSAPMDPVAAVYTGSLYGAICRHQAPAGGHERRPSPRRAGGRLQPLRPRQHDRRL